MVMVEEVEVVSDVATTSASFFFFLSFSCFLVILVVWGITHQIDDVKKWRCKCCFPGGANVGNEQWEMKMEDEDGRRR